MCLCDIKARLRLRRLDFPENTALFYCFSKTEFRGFPGIRVDKIHKNCYISIYGDLAQLVEHSAHIRVVIGSIPMVANFHS